MMVFETIYNAFTGGLFVYEVDFDYSPTKLIKSIMMGEWEEVEKRAKSHPHEAKTWVKRLNEDELQLWMVLPLHAAVVSQAPANVIKALLDAYPEGARELDDINHLPLHLVSNNFDPNDEVIYSLYEAYPAGILTKNPNYGMSACDYDVECPLLLSLIQEQKWDEAMKRVRTHPDEIRTWVFRIEYEKEKVMRWRLIPLHAAIVFNAPLELIKMLLEVFPQGANCKDDEKMTPLQRHLTKRVQNVQIIEMLIGAMMFPQPFIEYNSNTHMCVSYETLPTKMYQLIENQDWDGVIDRVCTNPEEIQTWVEIQIQSKNKSERKVTTRHLPLHFALSQKAPLKVIEALLTGYYDGIRCKDSDGNLPYLIARNCESESNTKTNTITNYLFKALEDPTSVSMKCQGTGDVILTDHDINPTPLFELIAAKEWDLLTDHIHSYPEQAKIWTLRKRRDGSLRSRLLPIHAAVINDAPLHVIEALLQAYGDGVSCRENHGMLPIHLAQCQNVRLDVFEALAKAYPEGKNSKTQSNLKMYSLDSFRMDKDDDSIQTMRTRSFAVKRVMSGISEADTDSVDTSFVSYGSSHYSKK